MCLLEGGRFVKNRLQHLLLAVYVYWRRPGFSTKQGLRFGNPACPSLTMSLIKLSVDVHTILVLYAELYHRIVFCFLLPKTKTKPYTLGQYYYTHQNII